MKQNQVSLKKKAMAWILSICLIVTLIPDISFAVTGSEKNDVITSENTEGNKIVEKTEDTTVYDLGDGEQMAVLHGSQVRYKNEQDNLVDYDPSLVEIKDGEKSEQGILLDGYAYKNSQGDKKQYIPEMLSEEIPILMESKEYSIEIIPTDDTVKKAGIEKSVVKIEKEKVIDTYENDKTKELPIKAVYGTKDDDLVFSCASGEHGIKQTIILDEGSENNSFEYKIKSGGLEAKKNVTNEGIVFTEPDTEEIVAFIAPPLMTDASEEICSENITYELREDMNEEGTYVLVVTIDESYFDDETRKYSVAVDLAVIWADASRINDVYVANDMHEDINFYDSGATVMPAGKNSTGSYETYIKFPGLQSTVSGKSISEAKFIVYEAAGSESKQNAGVYKAEEDWTESDLKYSNRAACSDEAISTVTSTGTECSEHEFDISTYVSSIADGTDEDHGLVLKNKSSNAGYISFFGSRSIGSYNPKIMIKYSDKTSEKAEENTADIDAATAQEDDKAPVVKKVSFKSSKGKSIAGKPTRENNPVIGFSGIKDDNINNSCISYALVPRGTSVSDNDYKAPADLSISSDVPYSGAFRFTEADQSLPTGQYTLHVKVEDIAGNEKVKSFEYEKDTEGPDGSITITDLVTGNEVTQIYKPVNIEIGVSGTGSDIVESSLKLYKATTDSSGNVIGIDQQSEKILTQNFTISENIVMDTIDICDSYGKYRLVLYLKDSVGLTKEITKDFDVTYTLPAPDKAKIEPSKGGTATLTWGFSYTPQQKIKLGSIEAKFNSSDAFATIVSPGSDGILPFEGSAEITVPNTEGTWDVTIRGKSKSGHAGEEIVIPCVVDKTAPVVNNLSFDQGNVMCTVEDANLKDWKIYAKEKNADEYGSESLKEGTYEASHYEPMAFLDLSEAPFEEGKEYTLKVVAEDKAGNIASQTIDISVPSDNTIARVIAPQIEIEKGEQNPLYGGMIFGSDVDTLTLKDNVQGATWYINNKESSPALKDENGNAIYDELMWNDVLAMKQEADGTRKYTAYTVKNGLKNSITFESSEISGNVAETYTYGTSNIISFRIKAQPGVATYQVKADTPGDPQYVTVQPDTTYYITDITEESIFSQGLFVKATANSGYSVNDSQLVIYGDTINNETFLYSDVEDYAPKRLSVEDKINYKTYVKWDMPEDLPDNISYEVYRSTEEDFVPDESTLVASGIKGGYYAEINAIHGKEYYYKVCALKSFYDEDLMTYFENRSSFSEVAAGRTVDENESVKRIGIKEFWEFNEFNTPNGNGYVEKSQGNFVYQQTDTSIANEGFDIDLVRTYNSQASTKGTFGLGWSHDYDIELIEVSEDDPMLFSHVALKDGNGTIYHFTRDGGQNFVSSFGSYVGLTTENTLKTKTVTVSAAGTNNSVDISYWFLLHTKDGLRYYFDFSGQLVLMEENNGNFIIFEHDPNKGVLSKMRTNNNVTVDFIYNDGKNGTDPLTVKEILLPDGSKVQYEYSKPLFSTDRLLTKVTEISGNESIEYEYEYDKPLLSRQPRNLAVIKEANNKNQYKIEYDFENDRVTQAEYPNGEKFTFAYADDNTSTITKKYSGEEFVMGEKDYFDRVYGKCVKSIRGVESETALAGTDETGLDVTTYTYRDNQLAYTVSTAQYHEINSDGYVVENNGTKENKAEYTGSNPVKETEDDGSVSEYTYYTEADGENLDDLIKTVKETNGDGKVTEYIKYSYDSAGNVTETIDYVAGTKVNSTYYTSGAFKGELSSMTEKLITVASDYTVTSESLKSTSQYSYQYDTVNGKQEKTETCVQTIPEPDGTNEVITTSRTYDVMGRLLKETDSRGYQTIHTYDGFGRITATTYKYTDGDQLKSSTSTTYDKNGMVTYEKLEDGIEKWYTYDNMGQVTSAKVKKGEGTEETINTSYRYEDVSIYRGKGNDTQDINNAYVVKETYADGTVLSETYKDHKGNIVRSFENGLYTDMTYNSQGEMITKWMMGKTLSATDGLLELYTYDVKGNQTAVITDPDYITGTSTTGYHVREDITDEYGNVQQGSIVIKNVYDSDGNLTEQTDAEGNKTVYTYDKNGDLLSVTAPDNSKYEYQYDIDGGGNTTKDIVKEPRQIKQGDSTIAATAKSEITKDNTDRIVKVEDLGVSDTDSTSISTSYEYDARDNLTKATDKEGNYRVYTYDVRDRLIAIDYYEAGESAAVKTLITEFTYDDADNMTSMTDKKVTDGQDVIYRYTGYGYDGFNRLIWVSECDTETTPTEAVIEANKISYQYDGKDRLTEINYPDSASEVTGLKFIYDAYGWLTEVKAVRESGTDRTLREYTYTNDGKVEEVKDYTEFNAGLTGTGKWLKRTYEYDELNRPTAIEYTDNMTGSDNDIKEAHYYEYDKNNNITKEKDVNGYGTANGVIRIQEKSHTYDQMGHLVQTYVMNKSDESSVVSTEDYHYDYDVSGNKTREYFELGPFDYYENTYTYNEFNQLVSAYEDSDLNGVLGNKTYTYDDNGNQVQISDSAAGKTTVYEYDADNRLKKVTGKTGANIDYTQENEYNGFGQRVQKKEGSSETNYFYDGTAVLYTEDAAGSVTSFNLIGAEDNILSTARKASNGTTSFYAYTKDIRESTVNIVGADGTSQVSYLYDAYGETTEKQKDSENPFYNEVCYTAGVYDKTTGLYNLNARYYSPTEGGFLTQDTYRGSRSRTETLNLYTYCAGNPISYTDPSGHAFWGVAGAAMGAYDGYKYAKKKNLKGWKKGAAVVGGALLGSINPFKVVKAAKTGYKAYKASKYTKKAVSSAKKTKSVKKASTKAKSTVVTKKTAKKTTTAKSTKKTTQTVKKQTKQVKAACFTAGTKIHTKDGFKNIEAVKAGDYVWSENPETYEKALKKVKKIFVREKDSIIRLSINGEVIETTDEHPFYVESKGWVKAAELEAGDEVRTADGRTGRVESLESITPDEPIKVYNFEVEDFHTYYVSGQKVLVHNTCATTKKNVTTHKGKSSNTEYVVGAYKDVKGIEGMDAHHVGQKAVMEKLVGNYDYKTAPAISVFREGHTIRLMGKGTVSKNTRGITSLRQLLARDIRELKRVYPDIPNSAYRDLIELNKKMYKEMK